MSTTTSERKIEVRVSAEGRVYVTKDLNAWRTLGAVASDFRSFLNYWHFIDQDTGQDKILGEVLWPAQESFVSATTTAWWIFFLKARQLGESTIECAYDGWVARFRDLSPDGGPGPRNVRVHIFSKRDDEAQELLQRVKYGLEHLPTWMQLPVSRQTMNEYQIDAGAAVEEDDLRLVKAYPTGTDPARGQTSGHAHVDEWAFMPNPARVWQAIEPSAAGTVHFVTTEIGPETYTAQFWRRVLVGDVLDRREDPVKAVFIGALERPDRDARWLAARRAGMDEGTFLREYPMRWEDALSAGGDRSFNSAEIDMAGIDFLGLQSAYRVWQDVEQTDERGLSLGTRRQLMLQPHAYRTRNGKTIPRKTVKAWDIGRHKDAAVCVVLDVTDEVHDVIHYERLRETDYPTLQHKIKIVHEAYPGKTVIEKNSAGEAVLENLNIPEHELEGWTTSQNSKARIIAQLKVMLQGWLLKWDPVACAQLDSEVRGYQEPDKAVVQDSVMALAIAEEYAAEAHTTGTVLGVWQI